MASRTYPNSDLAPRLGSNTRPTTGIEPELSGMRRQRPVIIHSDDDPAFLTMMRLLVQRSRPYHYFGFTDSRDALSACLEQSPALLITDLMHPIFSGLELIESVRADRRLASLPVLILSASVSQHYMITQQWLDERAVRAIRKPPYFHALLAMLDSMIGFEGEPHTTWS